MKKVLVFAGVHGNEPFGLKVLGKLKESSSPIQMLVAHPEAIAKRVRYIESDLNRSFNGKSKTLEERLAVSIKKELVHSKPDIVIDLHTSVSNCGLTGIVTKYSFENHLIAEQCGMTCVVIMPPSNALIEQCDSSAVALELGQNLRSDKLAKNIARSLEHVAEGGVPKRVPTIPVYEVKTTIPKSYPGLHTIKNLSYDTVLKGYPFLAGPNTYTDIGGFLLIESSKVRL